MRRNDRPNSPVRVYWDCGKDSSSDDIHLNDFYFVILKEGGEFYVEAEDLEAALQNLHTKKIRY